MSDYTPVEPLKLLPNRLEVANFSPPQLEELLAGSVEEMELAKENFNWLAAYLVEQVGLHEEEVTDWFLISANRLNDLRPLDVWSQPAGFEAVFDYAKAFKEDAEEDLAEIGYPLEHPLTRSQAAANGALSVIWKAFESAGVDLMSAPIAKDFRRSISIWSPNRPDSLAVRWKRAGVMEDYKISLKTGSRGSTYYIARHLGANGLAPFIMQSGVVNSVEGQTVWTPSDSDIDGRTPSAGDVAAFVIPLASETKKRGLEPMTKPSLAEAA